MGYEYLGAMPIYYDHCDYGNAKLVFRGPKKKLDKKYCATIGGTEAFGKYVEEPYPAQLEALSRRMVVNFGCMYAGTEMYLKTPEILDICKGAEVTVVELTSAPNMCNRFYSVHPRRNDRFISATPLLHSVYSDLDFTDVHFTGHLIAMLKDRSPARFAIVKQGLQSEWVTNMKNLLSQIGGKIILLWLSDHLPEPAGELGGNGDDPTMLQRDMIEGLLGENIYLVEIVATPEEIAAGHERMIFTPWEQAAVSQMLGPIVHQKAARQPKDRLAAT